MTKNNEFTQTLTLGLLHGKDLPFLAQQLALKLNRPVIVTNAVHRVLVYHDPLGLDIPLEDFLPVPKAEFDEKMLLNAKNNIGFEHNLQIGSKLYPLIYLPLQILGNTLGYCLVLNVSPYAVEGTTLLTFEPQELQDFYQTAIALLFCLKHRWEWEKGQEQLQDEIIRDILYNNYESKASIYEKAKLWHWELQGSLIVVVFDCGIANLRLVRELVPRLFCSRQVLKAFINDQLVIILNISDLEKSRRNTTLAELLQSISNRLVNYTQEQLKIGVGSPVKTLTDLYKSYQEAKVAAELGKIFEQQKIVCFFEEMGFLKFIFTQPAMELQEFCLRILGEILEEDLVTESDLVQTLRVFLECNGQIADSARALYIHENTLRNRLKKIEQLIGFDLRRLDHLFNIYIAMKILNSNPD